MPKALDLTNQKFNHLTAKEKAPNRGQKTYWLCECDCGNFKEIQTTHLVNGSIKSCGCVHDKNNIFEDSKVIICPVCKKEFSPNNSNRRYCYDCSPIGLSPADRIRYLKRVIKNILIQEKGGKCEICGYNNCLGALDFHHTDSQEKEFTLSQVNLSESFSMEDLRKEANKCIILCANCHRELHYLKD